MTKKEKKIIEERVKKLYKLAESAEKERKKLLKSGTAEQEEIEQCNKEIIILEAKAIELEHILTLLDELRK